MTAGDGKNSGNMSGGTPDGARGTTPGDNRPTIGIDEAIVEKVETHEAPVPPGVPAVTLPVREPRLRQPPFAMISLFIILIIASWIPLVVFARARAVVVPEPRVQLMQDMGLQPKWGPEHQADIFVDGRGDRPEVADTVAFGEADLDDFYYRGFTSTTSPNTGKTTITFFDGFPNGEKKVHLDEQLILHGQQRFQIYCSPCHGLDGRGNGMVNQRAQEDQQSKWTQPADFAQNPLYRSRPTGHLFNTITNGIRNMPAYGNQIPVEDRWAIVAYVRALQYSQNALPSHVPGGVTPAAPSTQPATQPAPAAAQPGQTPPGVTPPASGPIR